MITKTTYLFLIGLYFTFLFFLFGLVGMFLLDYNHPDANSFGNLDNYRTNNNAGVVQSVSFWSGLSLSLSIIPWWLYTILFIPLLAITGWIIFTAINPIGGDSGG